MRKKERLLDPVFISVFFYFFPKQINLAGLLEMLLAHILLREKQYNRFKWLLRLLQSTTNLVAGDLTLKRTARTIREETHSNLGVAILMRVCVFAG